MKKSIKYIALAIGSAGVFLFSLVFFSILVDYFNTNHDVTLILPMLCLSLLVAAIICTIVSAFKFSNEKSLKTILVITIVLYLLSATFHILGRIINPYVDNANSTPVATTYTYKKTIDKDVFLNKFFESLSEDSSITYSQLSNNSYNSNSTTSNYALYMQLDPLDIVLFEVTFNKANNGIESITIAGEPKSPHNFTTVFNLAISLLDENANLELIDKQCGLLPFVDGTFNAETNNFSVLRRTSDNFISSVITIK